MSYNAVVLIFLLVGADEMVETGFRVFISSTMTDLAPERDGVASVVQMLTELCNIVAVRAETFVASSASPRAVCLEQAQKCDLYLGIFDKRWGYVPPADNPEQLSVTALEYEAAKKMGRPRLVLVSSNREDRDTELIKWLDQVGSWDKGVFRKTYSSVEELKLWALASIASELMRRSVTPAQREALDAYIRDNEVRLQRAVASRFQYLRFNWLPQVRRVITDMPLESVYIETTAYAGLPDGDTASIEDAKNVLSQDRLQVHLNDKIPGKSPCVVILGNPGSGKSTYLRFLALQEARAGRLPILLEIREYARRLIRGRDECSHIPLEEFALEILQSWRIDIRREEFEAWLSSGRCTILLDGLDEVPGRHWRQRIADEVANAASRLAPSTRIVVTSRIVGYRAARLFGDIQHFTVQELSLPAVQRFLKNWFEHLELGASGPSHHALVKVENETQGLMGVIRRSTHVQRLARNPLMLTILALIHYQGSRLPERRIDLYRLCTDALVESIDQTRFEPDEWPVPAGLHGRDVRDILLPFAFDLHCRRDGLASDTEVKAEFAAQLQLQHSLSPAEARRVSDRLLDYIRERTGLLVEKGVSKYGFIHMTFEEYFAGVFIAEHEDLGNAFSQLLRPRLHDARWHETVLLAAAQCGEVSKQRAERFLRLILDANSNPDESILGRDLRLVLRCLADDIRVARPFVEDALQRVRKWVSESPLTALALLSSDAHDLVGSPVAPPVAAIALEYVHDSSRDVADHALRILYTLRACDGTAWSTMATLLDSSDLELQALAEHAIAYNLPPGNYDVIERLFSNVNPACRRAAIRGLARFPFDEQRIEYYYRAIADADETVKFEACDSVRWIPEYLCDATEWIFAERPEKILLGLCMVRRGASLDVVTQRRVLELAESSDALIADEALRIATERGWWTVETEAPLFHARSWDAKLGVIGSLRVSGHLSPAHRGFFLRASSHDNDPDVREAAARVLGELSDASHLEQLMQLATEQPPLLEPLASAIFDGVEEKRGADAAAQWLLQNPELIETVLDELDEYCERNGVSWLKPLLSHSKPGVRTTSMWLVGWYGSTEEVEDLRSLDHNQPQVKVAFVEALNNYYTRNAQHTQHT